MEHELAARRLLDALTAMNFPGVSVVPRMEYLSLEHGVSQNEDRVPNRYAARPWIRLRCRHGARDVDVHNPAEFWDMVAFADKTARNLIRAFTTNAETSEQLRARLQIHDVDVPDGGNMYRRTLYISSDGRRLLPDPLNSPERVSLDRAKRELFGRGLAQSGLGRYF